MAVRRPARRSSRPVVQTAVTTALVLGGVAALVAAQQRVENQPQPAPVPSIPTLEERVTKLERLANQPPLPPDPTVTAHAATTQPDPTAHLNAPADVKAAIQQLDARIDSLERRLTLLENRLRNPVAADEKADQMRQLSQIIEDARRTSRDLEGRVHRLEERNAH